MATRTTRRWPPYAAAVALALAVAAAAPTALRAQEGRAAADVSAELQALYEADQADRRFTEPPDASTWAAIARRDEERRDRVVELVKAGALATGADYYHAAMVLQHGQGHEDILLSHILATAAAYEGDERGKWLSAASLDRLLHRLDLPQRLGTQYVRDEGEGWSMGAYIEWLPDSVREVYGVPPLSEQRDRIGEIERSMGGGG